MAILVNYLKKNNRKETKRERDTILLWFILIFSWTSKRNVRHPSCYCFLSPLFFFLWSQARIGWSKELLWRASFRFKPSFEHISLFSFSFSFCVCVCVRDILKNFFCKRRLYFFFLWSLSSFFFVFVLRNWEKFCLCKVKLTWHYYINLL